MKKFLSVVLVAAMAAAALASCSGDEPAATTVPGTTPAANNGEVTTKLTAFETEPPVEDPREVEVPPLVSGDGLEQMLEGKTSLTASGKIDMESLATVGFSRWAETEDIAQMFDGVDTYDEWYLDENGNLKDGANPDAEAGPEGGGPGKIGGQVTQPAYFYFGLTEKATITGYVLTTGNDNSRWTGRNPVSWTLYGTNELETYEASSLDGEEFDATKWTELDYVWDGLVTEADFAQCGYVIDAENQGEFQYYVWVLEYTGGGSFQACELDFYVG